MKNKNGFTKGLSIIVDDKIDRRIRTIMLKICCVFVLFYYGGGFMVSYQMDTYYAINAPHKNFEAMLYNDGRWLNAALYYVLRFPWNDYSVFYYISFFLSLMVMTGAIYRFAICIYKEVTSGEKETKTLTAVAVISCITVGNLFSLEFFLYPDMMIMYILAIYLCVEATVAFLDLTKPRHNHNTIRIIIKAFSCLFLCVFMSETTAALFIILTLPFILSKSLKIKSFIINQLIAGGLYVSAVMCKVIFSKLVVQTKRASFNKLTFGQSALAYAPTGKTPQTFVLDRITFGMWSYALVFVLIVIALTVSACIQKRRIEILKGIYIVGVCLATSLAPYIFRLTNDYKPRIYYPLGATLGVIIIYGYLQHLIGKSIFGNTIVRIGVLIIIVTQWLSFFQMFTDQYITNYEDKYISNMIKNIINNYEDDTGKIVKYVVFYNDAYRTKYARNDGWCITQRGYDIGASCLEALNFYLGTSYKKGERDWELSEYYISKDWDCFSCEQIIIEDETAHICTY